MTDAIDKPDTLVHFDPPMQQLLDGKNFATVCTVDPDGGPQSSVVWYAREGDTVVFSTTAGRRKTRNLVRDPRVSLSVYDLADPYRYLEIRGVAEVVDDPDLELPRRMFHRYLGTDRPTPDAPEQRVIVRVHPHTITAKLG